MKVVQIYAIQNKEYINVYGLGDDGILYIHFVNKGWVPAKKAS